MLTYDQDEDRLEENKDNCTYTHGEVKQTTYTSSLYGNEFKFKMSRKLQTELLQITFQTYVCIELDANNPTTCQLLEKYVQNPKRQIFQVEKIDSIVLKNRRYYGAYRINLTNKQIFTSMELLVIHPKYGLLQFKRDGQETWTLH